MQAVIRAQSAAAMTSVEFIQQVGFAENGTAVTVSFAYNAINATTGGLQENTLTVPLITMMPIPYLKVCLCGRMLSPTLCASCASVFPLSANFPVRCESVLLCDCTASCVCATVLVSIIVFASMRLLFPCLRDSARKRI